MSFSFSGRHMEIGGSLANRAEISCKSLAKKYGINFIDVNIVMKKDGYLFHCDISVKTDSGNSYYSSNSADDPNVSFDVTLQKIDLQINKKRKSTRHNREPSLEVNSYDNSLEEETPVIVAEIIDDLPVMSVSSAAKRLNEGKKVFVFENVSNNAVNVVYVKSDGNIGWIDYRTKR
ncbi:MAG: sigma 54 modulation/S30EA ribosomal C-terminal domain-containing protein [Holosporaceae bacterium]|jgi:ribosomal subunit interface protein|nr:sigma 54 modulation/S30EA ribosomal C-terminal domain-containing protein [Holosporaceae bacterium]